VALTHCYIFTDSRSCSHTTGAIIAGAAIRIVPANIRMIVVGVSYCTPVDIHDSRIILEVVVSPPATIKS